MSSAIASQSSRADGAPLASAERMLKRPTAARRAQGMSVTAVAWTPAQTWESPNGLSRAGDWGCSGEASAWWLGDWLRYGNAKYGEEYTRAVKITEYDAQTLMNMAYVAARVDVSIRRSTCRGAITPRLPPWRRTSRSAGWPAPKPSACPCGTFAR